MAGRTTVSFSDSPMLKKKVDVNKGAPNFPYEAFCLEIDLVGYSKIFDDDDKLKEEHLKNVDALELLRALKMAEQERIETVVLSQMLLNYLEKNNPRSLIGLANRVETARATNIYDPKAQGTERESKMRNRTSGSRSLFSRQFSMSASIKRSNAGTTTARVEYVLNLRFKSDIAERWTVEIMKRMEQTEKKAIKCVREIVARNEELAYARDETLTTINNFKLHFMHDEQDFKFLQLATERAMQSKFYKWIRSWLMNGDAFLGRLRLESDTIGEICYQKFEQLKQKQTHEHITAADFQQLLIQREQLLQEVDQKFQNKIGLQDKDARIRNIIAEHSNNIVKLEAQTNALAARIKEVTRFTSRLEKESIQFTKLNAQDQKKVDELRKKLGLYSAPSVEEYMLMKRDIEALKKEEGMIDRKLNVINMQKGNLRAKIKRLERKKMSV